MDVQLVLELSAITAIISAGISYITFRKSSNLTYITQERKEWREAIRRIAEELEECPYKERKKVIVQLKTRINAYGLTNTDVLKDAHIWMQIKKIETCDQTKYDALKDQLIIYLSLLLKYDWEHSKKEVYGNPFQILGYVLSAITLILFAMGLVQTAGTYIMKEAPAIIETILIAVCSIILMAYMVKQERKTGSAKVIFYPALLIVGLVALVFFCAKNPVLANSYIAPALVAGFFAAGIQLMIEVAEIFDVKKYQGYVNDSTGYSEESKDDGRGYCGKEALHK